MKLRILVPMQGHRKAYNKGEVYDFTVDQAERLIAAGFAAEIKRAKKSAKKAAGEASTEEAATEEASTEEAATEEASTEEAATEEASTEAAATDEADENQNESSGA